jgi:hypothetical protein
MIAQHGHQVAAGGKGRAVVAAVLVFAVMVAAPAAHAQAKWTDYQHCGFYRSIYDNARSAAHDKLYYQRTARWHQCLADHAPTDSLQALYRDSVKVDDAAYHLLNKPVEDARYRAQLHSDSAQCNNNYAARDGASTMDRNHIAAQWAQCMVWKAPDDSTRALYQAQQTTADKEYHRLDAAALAAAARAKATRDTARAAAKAHVDSSWRAYKDSVDAWRAAHPDSVAAAAFAEAQANCHAGLPHDSRGLASKLAAATYFACMKGQDLPDSTTLAFRAAADSADRAYHAAVAEQTEVPTLLQRPWVFGEGIVTGALVMFVLLRAVRRTTE